jgi:transketolase
MPNAQLNKKIIFYYNGTNGEIRMGLPEKWSAPHGFEKIICNSAHEAEKWSERLRQYNLFKERLKDEEREIIEGQWRDELRSHIHHLMANSRNNFNRDAMRHFLQKHFDKDKTKMTREEYLHSEGHEHGH